MYGHTLHYKLFCRYCFQLFSAEEILKNHIKDCFKFIGKQSIIMSKNGEFAKFKNYGRKIKSPFIIHKDFESILVPEDNGKQNPSQPYNNKYQKHVACSYGYKLVCVNDKFSKPFKTSLEKDTVYNFIKSTIAEGKYCNEVMKKFFNKKFVMTEECNENFKNSTKC